MITDEVVAKACCVAYGPCQLADVNNTVAFIKMRAALEAVAPMLRVPDGWGECYGAVVRALAAVVCAHADENEKVDRDPIMAEVMHIRIALDKFSKSVQGPIQPTVAAHRLLAGAPKPDNEGE